MNRLRDRFLHGLSLLAFALVTAGCGGGGAAVPQTLGAAAQTPPGFDGATRLAARPDAVQRYEDNHSDLTLVSILQMNVAGKDASFAPYGWWDCFNIRLDASKRSADRGNDWPIYSPRSDESYGVPTFSFKNPCASGFDRGSAGDSKNYYVVMVSLDDLSSTVIAGPGTGTSTIAFPAANEPFAMKKRNDYVFFLVSTSGSLPTPTPAPTATPAAFCPDYTAFGKAPAAVKAPAPVTTAAPAGLFTFYPQSTGVGTIVCNAASAQLDALSSSSGFIAFTPSSGASNAVSVGTSVSSKVIAALTNGDILIDNAAGKGLGLLIAAPDGSTTLPVSFGGIANVVKAVTGADGNVYIAGTSVNQAAVFQVTPGGTLTTFLAPAACTGFAGAAAGHAGNLYFSDSGCGIVKMTTSGTFSTLAALAPGDTAASLAVGPDGALYYGSLASSAIVRVDPSSGAATSFTLPSSANNVLAIGAGPDGNLWFSADQSNGSSESGGAMGRLNFTTDAITLWPTAVAGTNDAASAGTSPTSMVAGPGGAFYGSTATLQNNFVTIDPSKAP
ncbi:MAG TPA: hypothetical protein VIK27_06965 [Candidatus Aquilonibacter sp.]